MARSTPTAIRRWRFKKLESAGISLARGKRKEVDVVALLPIAPGVRRSWEGERGDGRRWELAEAGMKRRGPRGGFLFQARFLYDC